MKLRVQPPPTVGKSETGNLCSSSDREISGSDRGGFCSRSGLSQGDSDIPSVGRDVDRRAPILGDFVLTPGRELLSVYGDLHCRT